MEIINETKFEKIKARLKENPEIVFTSEDDEFTRKIMEKLPIKTILINQSKRKDFQKQRNSGFNQVHAKIAKKNTIQIGINLDEIIESNPGEKSKILARTIQNIQLCNKNKIQMKFISQKYSRDKTLTKSLGLILGMPTWMTKEL